MSEAILYTDFELEVLSHIFPIWTATRTLAALLSNWHTARSMAELESQVVHLVTSLRGGGQGLAQIQRHGWIVLRRG